MNLDKAIRHLKLENERIELAIAQLEELVRAGGGLATKRRGRKSMADQERREVSERMKRYWAKRRLSQPG
jgi:hypothetical protein